MAQQQLPMRNFGRCHRIFHQCACAIVIIWIALSIDHLYVHRAISDLSLGLTKLAGIANCFRLNGLESR